MNETQQNLIDLKEEYAKLPETKDWFSAEEGDYLIVFAGEFEPRTQELKDVILYQCVFNVDVRPTSAETREASEPVNHNWSVTRAKRKLNEDFKTLNGKNSLWGQLCKEAINRNNGVFSGLKIRLVIKGKGINTRYTVLSS